MALGEARHRSGKVVTAYTIAGDCDPAAICSNDFEMEWPPRSGRRQRFPEVDRAAFFSVEQGLEMIHPAEAPLVKRLAEMLATQ